MSVNELAWVWLRQAYERRREFGGDAIILLRDSEVLDELHLDPNSPMLGHAERYLRENDFIEDAAAILDLLSVRVYAVTAAGHEFMAGAL
jgi:hypothetical protein